MKSKKYLLSFSFLLVFTILCIFLPDEVVARAGGGFSGGDESSGGSGSVLFTLLSIILAPFFMIYSAIVTGIVIKKNRQVKALLEKISKIDRAWDIDGLKARIEKTYFNVQIAWRDRNQDIAKEYMSERLYLKHKIQTDDMSNRGVRNVMESINLKEAKIIEVLDYRDNSKDMFWVHITGSMVDYTIIEKTGRLIEGEKKNNSFKELWKFKRQGNTWVLDEIDQDISASDIRDFNTSTEENLGGY